MDWEEASALPILDQSWLFLPLSTDPQNPDRKYLQCPATGHVYCLSTGSLFCNTSQMNPQTTNISSSVQRKDSCTSFSNSVPGTMKKSVNTKNTDQPVQGNGTSTAGINKGPNSKNTSQSVQADGTSITQSNKAPNVKSTSQHIHSSGTSTTSNAQSNKAPTAKHGDQCIQGSNASITPKNQSKTSSNVTSISDPTTKKQKKKQRKTKTEKALKKHCRTTQDESVHAQEPLYASSKNSQQLSKNETKKQNKLTVIPKSKPTTSFINSPSNIKHSTLITSMITPASPAKGNPVIKKHSKTHNDSRYNPFLNTKIKSFRYYNLNLQLLSNSSKPFEINLGDLLLLQNISPSITVKDVCQKSHTELQACLSFSSINKCSSKPTKKPFLRLSREDHDLMDLESSFGKKTAERKTFLIRSYDFNSTWNNLKPFNHRRHWRRRSLQGQYQNCRMAKNTDEKMSVSQMRVMRSSGVQKLKRRPRWIQLMEEEAIHKYKEKNYKHNLVVEDYGVLHHLEKSWLSANNNRNDISEDENEEFTDSSTDIVGEKNFSDSDENEDAPPTLQYSQGYESGCL